MDRRKQLSTFLKKRREQLTPQDVGMPASARRRTPGLRREEVALLAGVGVTWYTWLEQGRAISVSSQVLHGIARALKLDSTEEQYLFNLADVPLPKKQQQAIVELPKDVAAVVKQLSSPAYVINHRWEIIGWNKAAVKIYGDFAKLTLKERTILRFLLTNPQQQKRIVEWEKEAKNAVSLFKADTAKFIGEAWHQELVDDLTRECPQFSKWWLSSKVIAAHQEPKRVRTSGGEIHLATVAMNVQGTPGLRLYVQLPV